MSDVKSPIGAWNLWESLTTQEAESCLQYLAGISSGDSALRSMTEGGNQQEEQGIRVDAQGVMAEGMYRLLLEQLPVVTFMARLEGDFSEMYVSPQIEAMLGFSQQEWLGNPILWYERLHPEDKARWNTEFSHFLMLDEPFRSVYRFLARDGHVVWVRGEVKMIRDAQGRPVYLQGIGFDITEIKQADAALQEAHEKLERRVEERTAMLAQTNAALQDEIVERKRAEARLRQQAGALQRHQVEIEALNVRLQRAMKETHHRVKNNLQIIAALIDIRSAEDTATVSMEELKHIGTHISALAIIHDILTQNAGQDGQVNELSAREALTKLIALLQRTAGSHRLNAHIDDACLSPKQCTSLTIVINELIANALKYGRGAIEIRFTVQEGQAVLEVADNGPGFPADFDPMAAANFGLDLVEQVCRADLYAKAIYENRPQGGARVTIKMPLVTDALVA